MQYEIQISGATNNDGTISLGRLSELYKSLNVIAKGALQIRISGMSKWRGKTSLRLNNALDIRLRGLRIGSTILELECNTFKETLMGQQGYIFHPLMLEELPELTPVGLVIKTFQNALEENGNEEFLDKPLLQDLHRFKKLFLSHDEKITIVNQGSLSKLVLNKNDFQKIRHLEEQTPSSQQILIKGLVETLKYSNSKVIIQTEEGRINAYLLDYINPIAIGKYWGKEVTIAGTAHYRPSGRMSFIEIERIFEPNIDDNYFSKKKSSETTEQQIKRQLDKHQFQNHLSSLIGEWPDDEPFENLLNQLNP